MGEEEEEEVEEEEKEEDEEEEEEGQAIGYPGPKISDRNVFRRIRPLV